MKTAKDNAYEVSEAEVQPQKKEPQQNIVGGSLIKHKSVLKIGSVR